MEKEKLNQILNDHKLWLCGEGGMRADLRNADLRNADLIGADLQDANLICADLRNADLRNADLRNADLEGANLQCANLIGADLQDANLICADLRNAYLQCANLQCANLIGADLRNAYLRGANLIGANLQCAYNINLNCPEFGSFIGFKKAISESINVIVKLQITEDAKRSSATSRKCRCSKAIVLEIQNISGTKTDILEAVSNYDNSFIYKVGETVEVENFDDDRWNECAAGINFFITREEAVNYEN